MSKRCLVIGLGEFGRTLAMELARLDVEVVAVDISDKRAQELRDHVSSALATDVRDPEAIAELCSNRFDLAVVAMAGSLEASILATMHLKQQRVDEVWAEASDSSRAEVLRRVGADRVFSPERDYARRFAQRVARQDLAEFIPIADGYGVVEMAAPSWMTGKTLIQLELRQTHNVAVVSIKSAGGEVTVVPAAGKEILEGDILVLVGSDEDLARLREK
jgi:trk system potassium uptake protein TrkA